MTRRSARFRQPAVLRLLLVHKHFMVCGFLGGGGLALWNEYKFQVSCDSSYNQINLVMK